MFHWFGVVQNTRGDALPGWQVGLVDLTGAGVNIFADEDSTPIETVSDVANRAVADAAGNYDFFVPSGTYTLQFFDEAGVPRGSQRFVAMYGLDNATAAEASKVAAEAAENNAETAATSAAASATAADASADAAQAARDIAVAAAAIANEGIGLEEPGPWIEADKIGIRYAETGSKTRTFAEVARKSIELSGFTGADPTGSTDSMAAFKNALAACASRRAELVIDGSYRLNNSGVSAPTITEPTRIVGRDPRRGNIPGNDSSSQLYFEGISADGIIVNDTQLTVDAASITGRGRDTSGNAFRTIGENSALRLCNGALIQSFHTAVKYDSGYYHVIDDATIVDCVVGLVVSAASGGIAPIYNLIVNKAKFIGATQSGSGSRCADITNGSQVIFSECSFESFLAYGILAAGSDTSVSVTDSYFEGFGGQNILMFAGAAVNAYRNYVYLRTGAADWINAAENGVSINAGGNRFAIFTGSETEACTAYKLRLADSASQSNIMGDQWPASPGSNAVYVESPGNASFMRGKHVVQYPVGHPRQFEPINTLGLYAPPGFTGGTPPVTTMASWLANGDAPNDDPIGLRAANSGAWGGNSYLAVYQKGQWEKVGLRMPNIADATDEADALTKFNTLLARLRSAGVML